MNRIFVDSSAWCAFFNRDDPDLERVSEYLDTFEGRLVTSNFVFDETVTFCGSRLGHSRAAQAGEMLRDPEVVDLVRVDPYDESSAWALFLKRSDKRYSFTDCTSFVLMRRLGIERALAFDADFRREGFKVSPE
ncbi:MAG: type II toxin-antitoxin system VapC family toxin [Planctomycetaceae bacterium]